MFDLKKKKTEVHHYRPLSPEIAPVVRQDACKQRVFRY